MKCLYFFLILITILDFARAPLLQDFGELLGFDYSSPPPNKVMAGGRRRTRVVRKNQYVMKPAKQVQAPTQVAVVLLPSKVSAPICLAPPAPVREISVLGMPIPLSSPKITPSSPPKNLLPVYLSTDIEIKQATCLQLFRAGGDSNDSAVGPIKMRLARDTWARVPSDCSSTVRLPDASSLTYGLLLVALVCLVIATQENAAYLVATARKEAAASVVQAQEQAAAAMEAVKGEHAAELDAAWERAAKNAEQAASELAAKDAALGMKNTEVAAKDAELAAKDAELAAKDAELAIAKLTVTESQAALSQAQEQAAAMVVVKGENAAKLDTTREQAGRNAKQAASELAAKDAELAAKDAELAAAKLVVAESQAALAQALATPTRSLQIPSMFTDDALVAVTTVNCESVTTESASDEKELLANADAALAQLLPTDPTSLPVTADGESAVTEPATGRRRKTRRGCRGKRLSKRQKHAMASEEAGRTSSNGNRDGGIECVLQLEETGPVSSSSAVSSTTETVPGAAGCRSAS